MTTFGPIDLCRCRRTIHIVDMRKTSPIRGSVFCMTNLGAADELRQVPDYAALTASLIDGRRLCTKCQTNAKNAGVIP